MKKTVNQLDFEPYQYADTGLKTIKISNTLSSIAIVGNKVGQTNPITKQLVAVDNIGSNVQLLDEYCFTGCTELTGVVIPSNVKMIGKDCFNGCSKLATIDGMSEQSNNPIYSIDDNAFANSNLSSVVINLHGKNYNTDEDYQGCKLTNPEDGPYVGANAFKNCTNLKKVIFKKATELGNSMFSGCTSLTAVQFDSNYGECVGEAAFENCTSLQSITFPEQWEMISKRMFDGCTSLKTVSFSDFATTEPQLIGIEDYAFNKCNNLTSLTIPKSITDLQSFTDHAFSGSNIKRITFQGIPDSVFDSYKSQDEQSVVAPIDKTTTSNFKYGIWYRNCTKTLVPYAIENEIPVVMHMCGSGCGYCSKFAKNTFDKKAFQEWCAKSPYLFLDIWYRGEGEDAFRPGEQNAAYYFTDGDKPTQWGGKKVIHWDRREHTFVILAVFWPNKDGTARVASQWRSNGDKDETITLPQKIDGLIGSYKRDDRFNGSNYIPPVYKMFSAWGLEHNCEIVSSNGTKYTWDVNQSILKKGVLA